jgi:hypothetical protein
MPKQNQRFSMSRRQLLALSATGLPLASLLASMPALAAADAACKPVPDNDPVATAIKYVPDATKAANRPAKMGVEGKDQSCQNCQLFTANGKDVGKCTMIATGCVQAKGWCTAWVKKA